jgi:hypothetical protein
LSNVGSVVLEPKYRSSNSSYVVAADVALVAALAADVDAAVAEAAALVALVAAAVAELADEVA